MIRLPSLRIGDSFSVAVTLRDASNNLITGKAASLEAPLRSASGTHLADLGIVESGTAGTYVVQQLDTSGWPAETLETFVRYTDSQSVVRSTETLQIPMEE